MGPAPVEPVRPSGPIEPSDETVRDAVAATADPQLGALIAGPKSYVLRLAKLAGRRLAFFHVILLNVAHPAGFLLAFDPRSGRTEVTSQRPDAVAWVLSLEPELAAPETVWELIREPSTPQRLIKAHLEDSGDSDARRYLFDVEDGSGLSARWSLSLTDGGQFTRLG
jgi:hypothetical protein